MDRPQGLGPPCRRCDRCGSSGAGVAASDATGIPTATGINRIATGTRPVTAMPRTGPATTVTLLLVTTTATAVIAPGTRQDTMDTVSAALPVVWHDAPTTVADGSYLRAGRPDGRSSDDAKPGDGVGTEPGQSDASAKQIYWQECWKITQGLTREEAWNLSYAASCPILQHHEAVLTLSCWPKLTASFKHSLR